ncbi:ATP-binding protein [Euhalothece natronophila Z-M001]|uniref:ATP-binding protein n=1 Tax=Euhalothece natronophila Z-M001 TaxID=522448 RepID=A0A5B8NNX8_9CHRO|nr:FtsK/SpoIIIE domain-containing protein [Euhalothece natronophila]QDZ39889.1 ATP-binding protein [Euhalothece natronophila Z-M001]
MPGLGQIFNQIANLEDKLENLKKQRYKLIEQKEDIRNKIKGCDDELASLQDKFASLQDEKKEFTKSLNSEVSEVENKIRELRELLDNSPSNSESPPRLLSLPWDDPRWFPDDSPNAYQPQTSGLAPGVIRLGELRVENKESQLVQVPALAPTFGISETNPHILFEFDPENREKVILGLQSTALRIISTFPARKLQCIFIDPVNMGDTFPFKDLHRFIAGQKTYTRSDDIEDQLRQLTDHIEQVIQTYLGNDYQNLAEYNEAAQAIAEPYRYLFIADYPAGFTQRSLDDLNSILVKGHKAGVNVVLHVGNSLENSENKRFSSIFGIGKFGTAVLRGGNFGNHHQISAALSPYPITLDEPPPAEQFNQIIKAVTEATTSTQVDTIPFSNFYPEQPWSSKYDTRRGINTSIGLKGAKDKLEFWLGENEEGELTSHGLLAGKTGSGKSFTLHAIITSLAMKYSPEELELYLLDFKEGVEFQMYVNSEKGNNNFNSTELKDDEEDNALPHAKVVSIESDREFGLSVLEYINQQIEERSNQFKAAGNLNKLQEYRDQTGEKMPRILVVIDEFQYMFQENDQITRRLNTVMDNITRQGRAFGIHLVIASQSPNVQNMSREIYSQVDLRMVQQMDESTASAILGDGNTSAVDLLDKPGKVIYNKEFGKKNHNEIGQVANISAQERYKALSYIKSIAEENNYQRSEPLVVFNGSQPTNLNQNRQLKQLSEIPQWLSLKELNKQVLKEKDWIVQEAPSVAWLGEAMRIGNHTKAIFRSRPRSNMLLVGSSEEIIFGILSGILVSLVHSRKPETAQFKIIDLSIPDEDNYWTEMTTHFRDCFSPYFSIQIAKRFSDKEQQILKSTMLLREVYEEFDSRLNKRNENPDEEDFGETIFFIYAIGSLNQAQNLRPTMGRRNREELSEDAEKVSQLISQGSELGIHTILWVEDLKTFLKMTADDRSWLTHFDLRVGLTMSESDSRLMFGETYAQKLPRMRAYFYDDASNYLEKFKPYAVPTKEELSSYSEQFQKRY